MFQSYLLPDYSVGAIGNRGVGGGGDEKGDVSRETALQALRKDRYYQ